MRGDGWGGRETLAQLRGTRPDAPLVEQVKRLWDMASPEERQAICDRLTMEDGS